MAPNTEDPLSGAWRAEIASKEPQRPPVYNPEDYALSLKKWGRKNNHLQMPLSVTQSTASLDSITSVTSKGQKIPLSTKSSVGSHGKGNKENSGGGGRDLRSPVIIQPASNNGEMSLRQFSSATELLNKLKNDLQQAFPSFVEEFVGDPVDGVTLLIELLRAVQFTQAQQQQKCPPQIQRRALLDEHSCLICLQQCMRCADASRRLASSPAGLFTLAVCIMSNVTKSRVLALELLTKACEPPANGHGAVSDALSTLRLRFGEPVRFRFLVGMLNSAGAVELLAAGMKFINAFLETSPNTQQRVYIQAELEQAGFLPETLRKTLPSHSESVKSEINRYERNFIDVAALQKQAHEIVGLREKVQLLEKRIQILQEEKGVLRSLEQCLKERCSELEEEVSTKTSTTLLTARIKPYTTATDKGESTPAEDEGISSSEQDMSQDEEMPMIPAPPPPLQEPKKPPRRLPPEEMVKPPRNIPKDYQQETKRKDVEEDTTIEEVIEELENIAQHANIKLDSIEDRTKTFTKKMEKVEKDENDIIPAIILPQPPRRAKSLVHIFLSGRECDDGKNEFFDEETDSESSDSLLTRQQRRKDSPSFRASFHSTGSYENSNRKIENWRENSQIENWRDNSKIENWRNHSKSENWRDDTVNNWREASQECNTNTVTKHKPTYEERNIDEETWKRKDIVPPPPPYLERNSESSKLIEQSPFVRRTQRFVPVPVKRSQTFHTQEHRPNEIIKPKPKMGVSGLDLNKRDYNKNQNSENKNRYNRKLKDKTDHQQRRGSLDELQFAVENDERSSKRSISLERVDSSVESFVMVDNRKSKIDMRNIGPRTRRSLAESSLFVPPPQPKQRTSLARQHSSSSSTPLTLPVEIIPPVTRPPPDGSSSPLNYEPSSRKSSKSDETPIYATPNKPSKLQKFFGNPKFENSAGDNNHKYFESNYACLPAPRNAVKALLQPHPPKPATNFYLGTYQPSPPLPVNPPPPSLSSFGAPPFLVKRGGNAGMYTGSRENLCSPTPTVASNGSAERLSSASSRTTTKLSDSISGLY